MLPYYLLILLPFYFEWIVLILNYRSQEVKLYAKKSNILVATFFFIWCVMLVCRSTVCGIDLNNYEIYFYGTSKLDFFDIFKYHPIEQLYYCFNWIIAQIYNNFRLFLIITGCLCAGITGWFYWRETEHAPLTISLFVTNAPFTMFYSGLRQSLAMLFIVPAYYLTKQKKIFPFILTVLTATYFHTSAIVMLFLYPIFHISIKSKHFILTLGIVACFFMFNSSIFDSVLPFLGDRYMDRYGAVQETNGYSMLFFFILVLTIAFIFPDEHKMSYEMLGLRNVLILITLIQCFAPIHPLAMRMNFYFIMLFPIIIPKILNRSKKNLENVAQFTKWSLTGFMYALFFYKIHFTQTSLNVWPYVAYWE